MKYNILLSKLFWLIFCRSILEVPHYTWAFFNNNCSRFTISQYYPICLKIYSKGYIYFLKIAAFWAHHLNLLPYIFSSFFRYQILHWPFWGGNYIITSQWIFHYKEHFNQIFINWYCFLHFPSLLYPISWAFDGEKQNGVVHWYFYYHLSLSKLLIPKEYFCNRKIGSGI